MLMSTVQLYPSTEAFTLHSIIEQLSLLKSAVQSMVPLDTRSRQHVNRLTQNPLFYSTDTTWYR